MALKKKPLILLFFYVKEISQVQVEEIESTFKEYDVYFRKVVNNTKDIIEPFDAVAGAVPSKYIAKADAESLKVFDYAINDEQSGTDQNSTTDSGADLSGSEATPPAKQEQVTDALKPSDAAKATPAAATAPPPPPVATK